jgi:7-cyano-7-deazaguanine synthase
MSKSVILLSGGMDSLVTLALAQEAGDELYTLHLNYGQRTEARELRSFHAISDAYNVRGRLVVDVSHLAKIGGSSLTDKNIEVSKADLLNTSIPSSYVPFRNANILSVATSWAEVLHARKLYIGAVEEDSSGYPDCRKEFYEAFEKMIEVGTKPDTHIKIITPVIDMLKSEIIETGMNLNVPFELTWSCYKSNDRACGVCDSCALRLRAFEQVGIRDPIDYANRPNYL